MTQLKSYRNPLFLGFAFIFLAFIACRKTSSLKDELNVKQAEEAFYNKTEQLNPTLTGLVNSFKKQAAFNSQLAAFIEKNGAPVWDKTIYTLGTGTIINTGNAKANGTGRHTTAGGSADTSRGLFLIPLKSKETGSIQSYITASKHSDSNYTYRLYNKDSLDRIRPTSDSAKQALRTTEAVFGVFEKSINNKDSVTMSGYNIKNARIEFGSIPTGTNVRKNDVRKNDVLCAFSIAITLYYEWHDYSLSYGNQRIRVAISIQIDITCWDIGGGGGGGGTVSGYGDPNNSYWWQFGTGWPWNNFGNGQTDPWQYWWTGSGVVGGVSSSSYSDNNRTDTDYNTGDDNNNSLGNYDNTNYSDYDEQTQPWPTIQNIILISDFVGWNRGIHPNWQCMDYAKAQIAKKGYSISDYFATGQTIQIYTAANGIDKNAAKNAAGYLISALQRGIPVIVGVDEQAGSPNPNTDNTTDHFIVIIGMGTDANGIYFTFYDNASGDPSQGANTNNKLYYNPSTGLITGKSQTDYAKASFRYDYKVTMIRKSK